MRDNDSCFTEILGELGFFYLNFLIKLPFYINVQFLLHPSVLSVMPTVDQFPHLSPLSLTHTQTQSIFVGVGLQQGLRYPRQVLNLLAVAIPHARIYNHWEVKASPVGTV